MIRYRKPIMLVLFFALITQSYADVLQTSIGVNHTTPKLIHQTPSVSNSQSIQIIPYGELSDVNQVPADTIGIDFEKNPFIYGSGYHDTESDLEYMDARYYSADIGRFMAQDSYDLINRYNYANANPIMYIDPDGHMPKSFTDFYVGFSELGLAIGFLVCGGGTFIPSILAMAGTIPLIAGFMNAGDKSRLDVTASDILDYGLDLVSSSIGLTAEIYGGKILDEAIESIGLTPEMSRKVTFIPKQLIASALYDRSLYKDPYNYFSQMYVHNAENSLLTGGLYEALFKPISYKYIFNGDLIDEAVEQRAPNVSNFGVWGHDLSEDTRKLVVDRDILRVANSRFYYTLRSIYRQSTTFDESSNEWYAYPAALGVVVGVLLFV